MSSSAIRSSIAISPSSSTISVRRSSPYFSRDLAQLARRSRSSSSRSSARIASQLGDLAAQLRVLVARSSRARGRSGAAGACRGWPGPGSRRAPKRVHQARSRAVAGSAALADERDDLVDVVERDLRGPRGCGRAPRPCAGRSAARADHDLAAVLDEVRAAASLQVEQLRPAVDERQHDDAEGRLQRRVLVELVERRPRATASRLQLDDDAHALAVGLVAQVGDAVDLPLAAPARRCARCSVALFTW